MKRLAIASLATLAALACAAQEVVITISRPAGSTTPPPAWKELPDGRLQLVLNEGKVVVNDGGAVAAAAPKPAAAAPKPPAVAPLAAEAAPVAAASPAGSASSPAAILASAFKLQDKKAEVLNNFKNYRVDMSVPTTPAFAVLGTTPETILQPKAPRDLAVSLVQSLSNDDKLGKGVGFDIAPYMLAYGKATSLQDYQMDGRIRALSNVQLSFGAVKQDAASGSVTRAAGGASFVLFDEGDPRNRGSALAGCFTKGTDEMLGDGSKLPPWVGDALKAQFKGEDPKPFMAEATKQLSAHFDKCRKQFKQATWNSTRWTGGLAQAVHNRGGGTHRGANGFWTTYSLNLNGDDHTDLSQRESEGRSQALFHYRRTNREEVASTSDPRGFMLRRGDMLALGAKYGSDTRNLSIEASWQRGRFDNGDTEKARKLAIGGELMVSKDLWLVVSIGGRGGQKNGNNSPFVLGGLKFGSSSESTGAFGP